MNDANGKSAIARLLDLQQAKTTQEAVTVDDFRFYVLKEGSCIYMPTGQLWPGKNVDRVLRAVQVGVDQDGKPIKMSAVTWLAKNRRADQMTWSPGEPVLILDKLIIEAGWIEKPGAVVFNQYRAPTRSTCGDLTKATKWVNLAYKVYPGDAARIIRFFAHAVQRPWEKVNHGLLLGGKSGIGKDSIIAPAIMAVGPWNCQETSPKKMFGDFNPYIKAVILRINEAHDLGEISRYQLYEHLKTLTASPPNFLPVNEKNKPPYYVPNVAHVVTTTNHKTDGLFLPADDRRTDACWSELTSEDFTADYWPQLWRWYEDGGFDHVTAYLAAYNLSGFDPKAPPPKTQWFWEIVDANRAPEDAELADTLDALSQSKDANGDPIPPVAFTLTKILDKATELAPKDNHGNPERNSLAAWLADRKNRRQIPHRFEQCGFTPVRNDAADDGLWKIGGKRQVIYALASLSLRQRLDAARQVIDRQGETVFDLELFGAGR